MKALLFLREMPGAWTLCAFLILAGVCTRAEETFPERRELWVPADKLQAVLAKTPKAIVLSKEEYEVLLRDAAREMKEAPEPPRVAALSSAQYKARVDGTTLQGSGELLFELLSDQWTRVALPARGIRFGSIQMDGEAAFPGSKPENGYLLVRGRGQHKLNIEFTAPILSEAGKNLFNIEVPPAAASLFEVDLPANIRAESPAPARIEKRAESTRVSIVPTPLAPQVALSWQAAGDAVAGAAVYLQQSTISYLADAEKVRAEFDVNLSAQLGNLPAEFVMNIPKGAQVLQIEGGEVSRWSVADDRVRIEMPPRARVSSKFKAVIEIPSLAGAPVATVTLPVLKMDGVQRMEGTFSIAADGVAIRDIFTDAMQTSSGAAAGTVAGFLFNGVLKAPRVSLVRVESRLDADLDTLVWFKSEAILLERTLTLKEAQGAFFSASFKLPAGEELLSISGKDGAEPDWRIENGSIKVRWSDQSVGARVFKISSRAEPKEWAALGAEGIVYTVGDLQVEGVGKLTGYIALKAEPAFRLEAQPSETLEQRDGRATPVRGDYAWFRRKDFTLAVKVSRLPGEALAELTGYALPLEGMLDVHAQLAFTFLRSGVRSVRIQVPERIASGFHFEGTQIAERNLVGDIWTIVFQKELTGKYALNVAVQVPIPKEASDTFQVEVPLIEPLDVKRVNGVWAVEANTETEISFTIKGMNELDSLLAPALPGYSPRHRVIGVFNYLGGDHSLGLSGVRHGQAETLSSIVDALELETVVSTSGIERNEATIRLRSAGAQFLDVTLPPGSRLWSLTVGGVLVKPVGDKAGMVRVQLPAQIETHDASVIVLLYETPKPAWGPRGGYDVTAPRFSKRIPVLESRWRVYLPDGFQYTGFESNLRPPSKPSEPLLVQQIYNAIPTPAGFLRARKRAQATRVLSDLRMIKEGVETDALPPIPGVGAPEPDAAPPPAAALSIEDQTAAARADRAATPAMELPINPVPFTARVTALHDGIMSKEVSVPAGFIVGQPGVGPNVNGRMDAKIFLELRGIPFPPGASAVYLVDSSRLVVNNEEKNLRMVDQLVQPFVPQQPTVNERVKPDSTEARLNSIVIPKLIFQEATLPEAIDFLRRRSVALDPARRGVKFVLPPELQSSGALTKITITLTNVPLKTALDYITELANVKYKLGENDTVTIVPQGTPSDTIITREFRVRPGFTGGAPSNENGLIDGKAFLESQGIPFPPLSGAWYSVNSSTLVVRNTQENLDLLEILIQANNSDMAPDNAQPAGVAGLLPIKMELARAGEPVVFEGLYDAQTVAFEYEDFWARARRLWFWLIGGALLFYAIGARRYPCWRTGWAILILSFIPLCISESATPICNALLGGWLVALLLNCIAVRFVLGKKGGSSVKSTVLFWMVLLSGFAAIAREPVTVIVPYDPDKPVAEQQPNRFYLPYERFLELWERAKANRQPRKPKPANVAFVLNNARYEGRVDEKGASLRGILDVTVPEGEWTAVPLPFKSAKEFLLDGKPAAFDGKQVVIEKPGRHRIEVAFEVAREGNGLQWNIPRTAATMVVLALPNPQTTARITPGDGEIEQLVEGVRTVSAAIGSSEQVQVELGTAGAPDRVIEPAVATIRAAVTVSSTLESTVATFDFSFPQARQDRFTLQFEKGLTLVNLEAADLKSWKLRTDGDSQALELVLNQPATESYSAIISIERAIPKLPADLRVPVFSAGARRVEVAPVIFAQDRVDITPQPGTGLREVADNTPELEKAPSIPGTATPVVRLVGAFAGKGELRYRAALMEPMREAKVDYVYQVNRRKIELVASLQLASKGEELFDVTVGLPAQFEIEAIESDRLQDWWREGDQLHVRFKNATPATTPLVIYLVRLFNAARNALEVRPLTLTGFKNVTGEAVIAAHRGVEVGMQLTGDGKEIASTAAATDFQILAPLERKRGFRFRTEKFSAQVTLTALPAKADALWVMDAQAHESWVAINTKVRLSLKQGSLDRAVFTLPASVPEARIMGADVRETRSRIEGDQRIHEVRFQSEIDTAVEFSFELELSNSATLPRFCFPKCMR